MSKQRIAVFIDNSNVFHNIGDIRKSDKKWISLYDPSFFAKKIAGNRKLVYVGFYCVRPPSYLITENEKSAKKYNTTQRYYSELEKLPLVEVKYGDLKGAKGDLQEKNLDTQLSTDMVAKAALNEYDVAALVSNDGDYRSAVENTKIFGKKIETIFFKGSLSMSLREVSDITRRARRSYFQKVEGMNDIENTHS